jgi:hypothetical protein
MKRYFFENEKYGIRPIEENDKEQVKNLIKNNRFMGSFWTRDESMTELVDTVVQNVYINADSSFSIISKETGNLCGHIEISPENGDEEEGELSISLLDTTEMDEIMQIIAEVFKKKGHAKAKSITIQYEIE